jgi:hypothetical protein
MDILVEVQERSLDRLAQGAPRRSNLHRASSARHGQDEVIVRRDYLSPRGTRRQTDHRHDERQEQDGPAIFPPFGLIAIETSAEPQRVNPPYRSIPHWGDATREREDGLRIGEKFAQAAGPRLVLLSYSAAMRNSNVFPSIARCVTS